MNENMTPEELAVADDFEAGWSKDRLDNAEFNWGVGITDFLPHALSEKLAARAKEEGVSELALISSAVSMYLSADNAA